MSQYSEKDQEQIRDLQYLVTCSRALINNRSDQRNLENQLAEKDIRDKPFLPEGSPERVAVEAELQKKKEFYKAVMDDLQKSFNIGTGPKLKDKIERMIQKYPDQADPLGGIAANYNAWHSSQSGQNQQGQQGQTTPVQTPSSGKAQDFEYNDVFNHPPAQTKVQTSQSGPQSAYDKAFEPPEKPAGDPVMKEPEKVKGPEHDRF